MIKRNTVGFGFLLLIGSSGLLPTLGIVDSQDIFSYGSVKYLGFIKVAKQSDETWLFVDKDERAFYSLGVTAVRYDNRPNYEDNVIAKYGSLNAWGNATIERLRSWGFNTVGCWSAPVVMNEALPHSAYIVDLGWYAHDHGIPLSRFNVPDCFDPRWSTLAVEGAQTLVTSDLINDKSFMGYFIANDLYFARWSPVESPERNEEMFKSDIDDLLMNQAVTDPAKARLIELEYDYHQWLTEFAERYYQGVCDAIRAVDPNHLILGTRGLGLYLPQEDLEAQRRLDVVSLNFYQYLEYGANFQEAVIQQLQNYHNWSRRPIIIVEWGIRARECDPDVTNEVGAGPIVDTQAERAEYYNKTLSELSALPFVVGMHWFMFTDKMVGGENSNYGLVNVKDNAYGFISGVKSANLAVLEARTL